jgi:hypothetical protein
MKDKNRNIVALKRFLNYDHRIWTLVVIITILLSRAVVDVQRCERVQYKKISPTQFLRNSLPYFSFDLISSPHWSLFLLFLFEFEYIHKNSVRFLVLYRA